MSRRLGLLIAALTLAISARATAHELSCTKLAYVAADGVPGAVVQSQLALGGPEVILNHYPATVAFVVTITNPLAAGTSKIASTKDLSANLDFDFGGVSELAPGQSVTAEAQVTFETREECLAFGGEYGSGPVERLLQPEVCVERDNVFEVDFDGGLAQCRARVVCGEEVIPL